MTFGQKFSVVLSVLTVLIILALLAGMFLMPYLMDFYVDITDRPELIIPDILTAYYFIAPPTAVGLAFMLVLLRNIRRGDVFIRKNTFLLRDIAICSFVATVFCGVFGHRYLPIIICGLAGLFISLILVLLSNLFSAAVEIKEENELTI